MKPLSHHRSENGSSTKNGVVKSSVKRRDLRAVNTIEFESWMSDSGFPLYRAKQVFQWLHKHRVTSLDEMMNVPLDIRNALHEQFKLPNAQVGDHQVSNDGTKKLRIDLNDGKHIECVLIPHDNGRLTLCVSSQAGCALGCNFCATATLGLLRNLTTNEILEQVYISSNYLPDGYQSITNLVFMGMGEPLANIKSVLNAISLLTDQQGMNFSMKRITVSTVGLVPKIKELGQKMSGVGLAISLHATTDELRSRIMPVNRRYPIADLMSCLRNYPLPRRRVITFEYIVLDGLNHSVEDCARLVKLTKGIPCKINLLPYNPLRTDQPDLRRPSEETVENFAQQLREAGLHTTIRHSRGRDIAAACGQLALKVSPSAA